MGADIVTGDLFAPKPPAPSKPPSVVAIDERAAVERVLDALAAALAAKLRMDARPIIDRDTCDRILELLRAQREADAVAACAGCRADVPLIAPSGDERFRTHEFAGSGIRMPCAGELIRQRPLAVTTEKGTTP